MRILLFALFLVSCSTTKFIDRQIASLSQQEEEWSNQYLEAIKSCSSLKAFKETQAPSEDLKGVVELRYQLKCNRGQSALKNLKQDWLKREAVTTGLRTNSNPEIFAEYYDVFLKLNSTEKSKLEILERAQLYKNILTKVNAQTQKELLEKLLYMFPAFYERYKLPIPLEKQFEAGYGLRMTAKLTEAKKLYEQIIARNKTDLEKATTIAQKVSALDEISRAAGFIRTIYRIEQEKLKGIAEFRKAVTFFETYYKKNPKKEFSKFYTDSVVRLARDIWTEGNVTEAKKILESVTEKTRSNVSLDQVYWVLGRIEQEKQNYKGAAEYFEKALTQDTDKDFRLKLMWLLAWNLKNNKQIELSFEKMKDLASKAKQFESETSYYKSLYWQAEILKTLGKNEEAKELLEKIANENKFGYYGRLSLLTTNPDSYLTTLENVPQETYDVGINPSEVNTINVLTKIKETEILGDYLAYLWIKIGASNRKKLETKIQFVTWYHEGELYKENQQLIEIFDKDTKEQLLKKIPNYMYPQPHVSVVYDYYKKFKIAPEMVYSIMRQESLFDKKARSLAEAYGLLQLLPRVAARYQQSTGIYFAKPDELFLPEKIIPLGMAHMRGLEKAFEDSLLLTASSYNAGVSPTCGWLKSRFNGNVYEFIEDIPYQETETYTKLVFRNLSFYVQSGKWTDIDSRVRFLKNYFTLPGNINNLSICE